MVLVGINDYEVLKNATYVGLGVLLIVLAFGIAIPAFTLLAVAKGATSVKNGVSKVYNDHKREQELLTAEFNFIEVSPIKVDDVEVVEEESEK
jgi:hypothetical protein